MKFLLVDLFSCEFHQIINERFVSKHPRVKQILNKYPEIMQQKFSIEIIHWIH